MMMLLTDFIRSLEKGNWNHADVLVQTRRTTSRKRAVLQTSVSVHLIAYHIQVLYHTMHANDNCDLYSESN